MGKNVASGDTSKLVKRRLRVHEASLHHKVKNPDLVNHFCHKPSRVFSYLHSLQLYVQSLTPAFRCSQQKCWNRDFSTAFTSDTVKWVFYSTFCLCLTQLSGLLRLLPPPHQVLLELRCCVFVLSIRSPCVWQFLRRFVTSCCFENQ